MNAQELIIDYLYCHMEESGLYKYKVQLYNEYLASEESQTMGFELWLCDRLKRKEDALLLATKTIKQFSEKIDHLTVQNNLLTEVNNNGSNDPTHL